MSYRTVRHLCGHDARYRIPGSRSLVAHHLHELERSPCTPCADAKSAERRHIYLGVGTRIIAFARAGTRPQDDPASGSASDQNVVDPAGRTDQRRASASA